MKYKIVRDGHGRGKEVLFQSDDLMELARFCEEKSGGRDRMGGQFDLGIDGDDLL